MNDTQQKIIDAAHDLFRDYGFKDTTTRQIAEAAGVNEVTLFRHFGSKEKLFESVIDCAMGTDEMPQDLRELGDLDTENLLRALANGIRQVTRERSDLFAMVMRNIHQVPALRDSLNKARQPHIDRLRDLYKMLTDQKRIRDIDPSVAATLLFFPIAMANVHGCDENRMMPDDIDTDELIDTYIEMYLNFMLETKA